MRTSLVAGLVLATLCSAAFAQMYRWVDRDGRVHYTQTPPPADAKSVQKKALGAGSAAPAAGLPYATQEAARKYPVSLYTTPDCGAPCDQARSLLVKRTVPFEEISVQRANEIENLKTISGGTKVPVLVVGSQKQAGFLEDAYSALLDTAGYPASGPRLPLEALRKITTPEAEQAPGEAAAPQESSR